MASVAADPLERGQANTDDDDGNAATSPPAKQQQGMCNVPRHWMMYGGVCALLALQNSSYTLVRRFGHGVLREEASSQSILAVGELMKLGFCVYMVLRDQSRRSAANAKGDEDEGGQEPREDAHGGLSLVFRRLASTSAPMAVPALIFLAMNLRACPPPLCRRRAPRARRCGGRCERRPRSTSHAPRTSHVPRLTSRLTAARAPRHNPWDARGLSLIHI